MLPVPFIIALNIIDFFLFIRLLLTISETTIRVDRCFYSAEGLRGITVVCSITVVRGVSLWFARNHRNLAFSLYKGRLHFHDILNAVSAQLSHKFVLGKILPPHIAL